MKKIVFMLLTLIVSLAMFGTAVVAYANGAINVPGQAPATSTVPSQTQTPGAVTATPQPAEQPTQPTVQPTQAAVTPTSVPLKSILSSGDSNKPEIALTIDDGPSPTYTQQFLSILQQYGIHATFFVVGENVQNYPDLVRQEVADGHLVGNHTWDHPDLTTLSGNAVRTEISSTSDIVQQTTGIEPTFFRPPYGAINYGIQTQASQLGLTSTTWNVDPQDWSTPGTQIIINRVLNQVANGSIILMHDGGGDRSQSVAALKVIIPTLQQRGYQFVTVQQMANELQQNTVTTNFIAASINLPALVTDMDLNIKALLIMTF